MLFFANERAAEALLVLLLSLCVETKLHKRKDFFPSEIDVFRED